MLAGFIIGSLGVLDDVTVTQTSAVWELKQADPTMSARAVLAGVCHGGIWSRATLLKWLVFAQS